MLKKKTYMPLVLHIHDEILIIIVERKQYRNSRLRSTKQILPKTGKIPKVIW